MLRACSFSILLATSCASVLSEDRPSFLSDAAELEGAIGAQLVLSGTGGFIYSPELQGRVMTSAVDLSEPGQGYWNIATIDRRDDAAAFHNHGGEERFWIGPEGSRFSFYFDEGVPFSRDLWRVPDDLNRGSFEEVGPGQLERSMHLTNRVGSEFYMLVQREIRRVERSELEELIGALPEGTLWTGFATANTVTNSGETAWLPETGLPAIWIAGMFLPGESTWAILPFRTDRVDPDQGPAVRSDYFGALDDKRLRTGSNFALFRTDAEYTSKVGILRNRARPIEGAYDPDTRTLTLVRFGPIESSAPYVDERWRIDGDPYYGDVVNSYNHGGPEPFYELESSSPALALAPGESHTHHSMTVHIRLQTDRDLAAVASAALGVDWQEVVDLAGW